jgi:DNA-binding CsgD family transcriptional regulator
MTDSPRSTRSALGFDLSWAKGYLDLIASGVSLEQLLRHSHEEIGSRHAIAFSQIFTFDQEGNLTPTTTFGINFDGPYIPKLSKDELHPVTDCARTEDSLAIPSHVEYQARYPGLTWGNGPSIFIPLRVGPLVDSVFVMVFREGEKIDWSANLSLHEAIYVIAQLAHLINNRASLSRETSGTSDTSMTLGLSDRQLVIAKMIAQGMTNKTIAHELGFSEATIRYETIKLYERLRVRNRSHAAARIHQLGIS